jgi:ribosomal-protein-alanine N-acetyltransferase
MYEILKSSITHVFHVLKLHRIMANYIPDNIRSGKLLEKLGFKREGLAESYLKINGEWQDHVLTSLISDSL